MNQSALVLNKSFYAIHIADVREIMAKLYTGEAQAVDENCVCYDFKDWVELSAMMAENRNGFINTVTMRVAVPDVIRLTRYSRLPKRAVKFSRQNIYQHYNRKCCYCAEPVKPQDATWDHVIPRERQGKTDWTNIVLACRPCNGVKANKMIGEAAYPEDFHIGRLAGQKMTLLVKPSRPEWKGARTITVTAPAPIPVAWQTFIDRAYWESEIEP